MAAAQDEAWDSQGEKGAGSAAQWWDILESVCESALLGSGPNSTPASRGSSASSYNRLPTCPKG